ncbi:MAG: iron-containing alcohol dehydrogenase [Chloroflexota bacterium]|nr:iron-containing alcohol dehydrogenase [Chloroflexota bacterium]
MTFQDEWGPIRVRPRDPARAFHYQLPTEIVFGEGRIVEIAAHLERCDIRRPLIVTDQGVRAAGIIDRVEAALSGSGVTAAVYDAVTSDPRTSTVEEVRRRLVDRGHDGTVGIGGGSALDVAKAAAALVTNPGSPQDYVGRDRIMHDPLPVIAVPTTAGTGSEVTMWSVLTDDATGAKVSIGSVRIMPRVALLDPELTYGLPPALTAATGMDALSHAVESYGSVWNHPIAEPLALRAIELVGHHLRNAVADGTNRDARRGMLMASLISELAANSTRLGLCHALAIPLGARHHVPHGLANAMLLSAVARYNAAADHERYATIGFLLDRTDDAAAAIANLRREIGVTDGLARWEVGEDDFGELADMAMRSDNVQANPREADREHLIAILRSAL